MLKKFFIWCSGVSPAIVLKCDDKEQVKYTNIGIVVLAVAILSTFSSTFFLSFAFDTGGNDFNFKFFPIGIIWGFIILSLDRAIVSTINKNDKIIVQILKSIPRFALALMIGIVVATPLEFKIFDKEITNKITAEAYDIVKSEKEQYFQSELQLLTDKAKEAEQIYLNDKKMYDDEVSGRKSGIPGKGARADEYMKNELASLKKYNIAKDSLTFFKENLVELEKNIDYPLEVKNYINENVGVVDRVKVSYTLGPVHTLVSILFITIELLPLLIKLMSAKGSYEEISKNEQELSVEESTKGLQYSVSVINEKLKLDETKMNQQILNIVKEQEHKTALANNKLNNDLEYDNLIHKHKLEKTIIDNANELKLHTAKSEQSRINKEKKLGFKKISNSEKIEINKITNSDVTFDKTYWRLVSNPDKIYYFDTKQTLNSLIKPLYLFTNGSIENGTWHTKIEGKHRYIVISIHSNKNKYKLETLTENSMSLSIDDNILEFEKVSYL